MDSLSKVLVSLRKRNIESPEVIYLPLTISKEAVMERSYFHYYMRITKNIICL